MRQIPALIIALVLSLNALAPARAQGVEAAEIDARLAALEKDDAPEAQQAAMTSLVKLGADALPHLIAALGDKGRSWPARSGAAWVLGEIADARAVEALNAAWADAEAPGVFKVQVATALAALGQTGPLRSFLDLKGDAILAAKAATALANVQDRGAVEAIKPLLSNADIAPFVALALGRLGDDSGRAEIEALGKEPMFRDYVAVALGALGDKKALMPLRFALSNPDPFIRRDAAEALGRLEDASSLAKLEEMAAADPDARAREAAAKAARKLSRKAPRPR